jgi:hypothetical protein
MPVHKAAMSFLHTKTKAKRHCGKEKLNYIHLNPVSGNYKLVNDGENMNIAAQVFMSCNA